MAKRIVKNQNDVLELLGNGEISVEQATELLDQLNQKPLTCYWTEKGAVGVKGLRKLPVKLYPAEWERLAGYVATVVEFAQAGPPEETEGEGQEAEAEDNTEEEAAA